MPKPLKEYRRGTSVTVYISTHITKMIKKRFGKKDKFSPYIATCVENLIDFLNRHEKEFKGFGEMKVVGVSAFPERTQRQIYKWVVLKKVFPNRCDMIRQSLYLQLFKEMTGIDCDYCFEDEPIDNIPGKIKDIMIKPERMSVNNQINGLFNTPRRYK